MLPLRNCCIIINMDIQEYFIKRSHILVAIIFCLVCIMFPLTSVSAEEQVTGFDKLYEILQPGEFPVDNVIGKIIEPDPFSYEYSLAEIIQAVFLSSAGDGNTENFIKYIDEDTLLMFTVLHEDTIIPMLPAETFVMGQITMVNEIARVPVRLFFQSESITGDIFFLEKHDGWKIFSADFDFSGSQ